MVPCIAALEYDLTKTNDPTKRQELAAQLQMTDACRRKELARQALMAKQLETARLQVYKLAGSAPSLVYGAFRRPVLASQPTYDDLPHERISGFSGKRIAEAIQRRLPRKTGAFIAEETPGSENDFNESLEHYQLNPSWELEQLEPYTNTLRLNFNDVRRLYKNETGISADDDDQPQLSQAA